MGGKDFEDLDVYKVARELRAKVYRLTTELPPKEKYNLVQQMRRAALSVTNNIAEGHGTYTYKHNVSFLHRARGSAYELRDDFSLCEDEKYLAEVVLDEAREATTRVIMLIDGYIRYLRKKHSDQRRDGSPESD